MPRRNKESKDRKELLISPSEKQREQEALKTLDNSINTFSKKAAIFAREVANLPGGIAGAPLIAGGSIIGSVGEFGNLIDKALFAKPSENNRLGGLIPLCVLASDANKALATKVERIMSTLTGVDPLRNDIFGYGWVATQAHSLARKIRSQPDQGGVLSGVRNALADVVEAFGNMIDAIAKVLYLPAFVYRMKAEITHRLVDSVQKLTDPIHKVLSSLSNLCTKFGNWIKGAGKTVDYGNQVERAQNHIKGMLSSINPPPKPAPA